MTLCSFTILLFLTWDWAIFWKIGGSRIKGIWSKNDGLKHLLQNLFAFLLFYSLFALKIIAFKNSLGFCTSMHWLSDSFDYSNDTVILLLMYLGQGVGLCSAWDDKWMSWTRILLRRTENWRKLEELEKFLEPV